MSEVKEYTIGEKKYLQRRLVLGQWQRLMNALRGISLPESFGVMELIFSLGDQLHHVLAAVLVPDNVRPQDVDVEELAAELAFTLDEETALQVVEDFFTCNPTASIFEKLTGIIEKMAAEKSPESAGPKSSAQPSPPGTSPRGGKSSGRLPRKKLNRT